MRLALGQWARSLDTRELIGDRHRCRFHKNATTRPEADCETQADDVSSSAGSGMPLAVSRSEVVEMSQRSLVSRVTILEEEVASLEGLPERGGRLEWQILPFRDEVRSECSAIRAELHDGQETLREEMRAGQDALRAEVREGDASLNAELKAEIRQLRDEVRTGDEETRRFMRILHEELVARIAAIGELRPRRKRR
jgi:hypothetical protein